MKVFPELCLASQSPRRVELLKSLRIPFYAISPSVEEGHPASMKNAGKIILDNAERKARSVAEELKHKSDIIVAADTLVLLSGEALGKPTSREDGFRLLKKQSGKKQLVLTGLVLFSPKLGMRRILVKSSVWFSRIPAKRIKEYLDTKEPYDKAGAYAVQGLGARFIERIEGSYTNVMGFPLEVFLRELEIFSGLSVFEWCSERAT